MKYFKYIICIAVFSVFSTASADNAKEETCIKGFKGAIAKYKLATKASDAGKYCKVIAEGIKTDTWEDLLKRWNGLDHSLMISQAYLQGEKQGLASICKAGAYAAIGNEKHVLKKAGVSNKVAAYEVCIGPVKEGSILEEQIVDDNGTLRESFSVKLLNGKFVKHGLQSTFHKSGKALGLLEFKDGKKHGTVTYFNKDEKKIEETTYKNGVRNGSYTKWDTKTLKIVKQGNYKDAKQDGVWKFFAPDGSKQREITFAMGKTTSKKTF